jgi:hypothetical protein
VKWSQDPATKPLSKHHYYKELHERNLGPGEYEVSDGFKMLGVPAGRRSLASAVPVGKLYHTPTSRAGRASKDGGLDLLSSSISLSDAVGDRSKIGGIISKPVNISHMSTDFNDSISTSSRSSSSVGPGSYDVSKADKYTKHSAAKSYSIYRPDSKPTIQMQLKQYREEKSRDLRDFHDNQVLAQDSIIRKRSVAVIIPDGKSVIEKDMRLAKFHENKRIVEASLEKRREEGHSESMSEDDDNDKDATSRRNTSSHNNIVEKRSIALVSMDTAKRAAKDREDLLLSKPTLAKVLADKQVKNYYQFTIFEIYLLISSSII